MNKPIFSVIASVYRDYMYEDFYNSFSKDNTVSFEIIFVGPNPPKEKMPSNFTYIETEVKPVQCFEIAARKARGEYLIYSGDDLRVKPRFFDKLLYNWINRLDMDKILLLFRCRYSHLEMDDDESYLSFDRKYKDSPIMGMGGVFKKEIWHKLGGLDKRFYFYWADYDMVMRFYDYGYSPFLVPDCIILEEKKNQDQEYLNTKRKRMGTQRNARHCLNRFWRYSNGEISKIRLYPVCSFEDKDILIKNQYGPKLLYKNKEEGI